MSNPDGVLAAIDACLDDYYVSDDAMRWAPDEPEPELRIEFRLDMTPLIECFEQLSRAFSRTLGSLQLGWAASMEALLVDSGSRLPAPSEPDFQTEMRARIEQAYLLDYPKLLAKTVSVAGLPEPDGVAPGDPPAPPILYAPVLPPPDDVLAVSLSEGARRSIGPARRLPNTDAQEALYSRRRNRR
ncbi:hypothetical protein ACIBCT_20990 [Streptosporangium sp. NPDC050855]|uniref:hypothetical protein n=1 Tax=Streptosporangium sp. NPDC050855 TaxID=3366194 RepID=UPI0037B11794